MVNTVSPRTYTSPPLAGGDKGEGDIIDWKLLLFTLTPTLSRSRDKLGIYDKGEGAFSSLL